MQKSTRSTAETGLLTKQLVRLVEAMGGCARRVNTTGIPNGRGGFRKNPAAGFEDIDACLPVRMKNGQLLGLKVAIEVKTGRDTMSPEQEKRQSELEASGGIYITATGIEQAKAEIVMRIRQKTAPA